MPSRAARDLPGTGRLRGVRGARWLVGLVGSIVLLIAGIRPEHFEDASLIEDGRVSLTDETVLERHQVYLRKLDVESIGTGGGSIAWFDEGKQTLRVGPQRAGDSVAVHAAGEADVAHGALLGLVDLGHGVSQRGEDEVDGLAGGLDTQLGPTWPDGVEVSFGQWQKLALARGLAGAPLISFSLGN